MSVGGAAVSGGRGAGAAPGSGSNPVAGGCAAVNGGGVEGAPARADGVGGGMLGEPVRVDSPGPRGIGPEDGGGELDGVRARVIDGIGRSLTRRARGSAPRLSSGGASRRCAAGPGEIAASSERRAASSGGTGISAWLPGAAVIAPGDTMTPGETGCTPATSMAGGRMTGGGGLRTVGSPCPAPSAAFGGPSGPAGTTDDSGGGSVVPDRRGRTPGMLGAFGVRGGSMIPVAVAGGALRARGGAGGRRRPQAAHTGRTSGVSAPQNGHDLIAVRPTVSQAHGAGGVRRR